MTQDEELENERLATPSGVKRVTRAMAQGQEAGRNVVSGIAGGFMDLVQKTPKMLGEKLMQYGTTPEMQMAGGVLSKTFEAPSEANWGEAVRGYNKTAQEMYEKRFPEAFKAVNWGALQQGRGKYGQWWLDSIAEIPATFAPMAAGPAAPILYGLQAKSDMGEEINRLRQEGFDISPEKGEILEDGIGIFNGLMMSSMFGGKPLSKVGSMKALKGIVGDGSEGAIVNGLTKLATNKAAVKEWLGSTSGHRAVTEIGKVNMMMQGMNLGHNVALRQVDPNQSYFAGWQETAKETTPLALLLGAKSAVTGTPQKGVEEAAKPELPVDIRPDVLPPEKLAEINKGVEEIKAGESGSPSDDFLASMFSAETPEQIRYKQEKQFINEYKPPNKGRFMQPENVEEITKAIDGYGSGKLTVNEFEHVIYENLPLPKEQGTGMIGDVYGGNIKDNISNYVSDLGRDIPTRYPDSADTPDFLRGKETTANNVPISKMDEVTRTELINKFKENPAALLRDVLNDIKIRLSEDKVTEQNWNDWYGEKGEFNPDYISKMQNETAKGLRKSFKVLPGETVPAKRTLNELIRPEKKGGTDAIQERGTKEVGAYPNGNEGVGRQEEGAGVGQKFKEYHPPATSEERLAEKRELDRIAAEEAEKRYPTLRSEAKAILVKAAEHKPVLDAYGEDIAASVGGTWKAVDNKEENSLMGKIDTYRKKGIENGTIPEGMTPEQAFPVTHAPDLTRGSVIVPSLEKAPEVISRLRSEGWDADITVDPEVKTKNGYRGMHLTITAPNGITSEIQVHTPESMKLKIAAEEKYFKWRRYSKGDFALMQRDVPQLWDQYLAESAETESAFNGYWGTVPRETIAAILEAGRSKASRTSPNVTSPTSMGRQLTPPSAEMRDVPSVGLSQTSLPSSSSRITGVESIVEPPSKKNIMQDVAKVKEAPTAPSTLKPEKWQDFVLKRIDHDVFKDIVSQTIQKDGQKVIDAANNGDIDTLETVSQKYSKDVGRDQGGGGAGPGRVKQARHGAVAVYHTAQFAIEKIKATRIEPRGKKTLTEMVKGAPQKEAEKAATPEQPKEPSAPKTNLSGMVKAKKKPVKLSSNPMFDPEVLAEGVNLLKAGITNAAEWTKKISEKWNISIPDAQELMAIAKQAAANPNDRRQNINIISKQGQHKVVDGEALQSRVWERLQEQYPEELKGALGYRAVTMRGEAGRAVDLAAKDPAKLVNVATGIETDPNVTQTAANIVLQQLALERNDVTTFRRAVSNLSLAATRAGQEISMLRLSLKDVDPASWLRQLIRLKSARLDDTALSAAWKTIQGQARKGSVVGDLINKEMDRMIKERGQDKKTLSPAELISLQEKAMENLGIGVSNEETATIMSLAKKIETALGDLGPELGNPEKKAENIAYLKAVSNMNKYLLGRVPSSNLRVLTGTIGRGMMLFSIKSPVLNILSNAVVGTSEALTRRLSRLQYSQPDVKLAKDYWRFVWEAYQKTGFDLTRISSISENETGGQVLGETVHTQGAGKLRAVGRAVEDIVFKQLMGAPDVAFSGAHFVDSVGLWAKRIAKGDMKRARELMIDAMRLEPQTDEGRFLRSRGVEDARIATWTNKSWASKIGGGIRKVLNDLTGDVRFGDFFVPFERTPSNVVSTGMTYGGLGIFSSLKKFYNGMRTGTMKERGQIQNASADLVRAGLGMTAAYMVSCWLKDDDYRGEYDPRTAQGAQLENAPNRAIRIGDRWIQLDYFGPLEPAIIAIMEARKQQGQGKGEQAFQYGAHLAGSVKNIAGVSDIGDIYRRADANKNMTMKEAAGRLGKSVTEEISSRLIPAIIGDVARATDTTERQTKNPLEALQNKVPILREKLPPKTDIFGREVKTESSLSTLLFGRRVTKSRSDEQVKEIQRLESTLGKPLNFENWEKSSSVRLKAFKGLVGAKEFATAFSEYKVNLGKEIARLMTTPNYLNGDDEERGKMLMSADSKVRDQVIREHGGGTILKAKNPKKTLNDLIMKEE